MKVAAQQNGSSRQSHQDRRCCQLQLGSTCDACCTRPSLAPRPGQQLLGSWEVMVAKRRLGNVAKRCQQSFTCVRKNALIASGPKVKKVMGSPRPL